MSSICSQKCRPQSRSRSTEMQAPCRPIPPAQEAVDTPHHEAAVSWPRDRFGSLPPGGPLSECLEVEREAVSGWGGWDGTGRTKGGTDRSWKGVLRPSGYSWPGSFEVPQALIPYTSSVILSGPSSGPGPSTSFFYTGAGSASIPPQLPLRPVAPHGWH